MRITSIILFILLMLYAPSYSAVIFSENFDSQADWTLTQSTSADRNCWNGSSGCISYGYPPTNWDGYYNGFSYCGASAFNNNYYINQYAGYPEETNTCHGGSGKCITFWDESCTTSFVNSDGWIIKDLEAEYQTLYVRVYVKFQVPYSWTAAGGGNEYPQHKLYHIQSNPGAGTPWMGFGANNGNQPSSGIGFQVNSSGQSVGITNYFRTYCGLTTSPSDLCYYPNTGTPNYSSSWVDGNDASGKNQLDVNNDYTKRYPFETWGSTVGKLGDGNWHYVETMQKMNTWNGSSWNANGELHVWVDGVLQTSRTNIPYHKTSGGYNAETDPIRGFRVVGIGGNTNNYWSSSGDREQWYAVDNVCISTTYIGDTVCGDDLNPSQIKGLTIQGTSWR